MPSATEDTAHTPKDIHSASRQKLPALTPRKPRASPRNPLPVPETPVLPDAPNLTQLQPTKPTKRILSEDDHRQFLASPTYSLVLSFVFSLSESCADTKISSLARESQPTIIQSILSVLSSISSTIDSNPPVDQRASRFGNPAFRSFIDSIVSQSSQYHKLLAVPEGKWTQEVSAYLEESFGSRARIDYGSGHELNFVVWLLCLNRLSLLPPSTFPAISLLIFPEYIRLLRRIQSTYYLEPAGSHGVWGLDDYHFLPFLFGASQLLHHPYVRPLAIHNDLIIEEEGDDFMYLDMVRWTMATKTVKGLKWTQPMLDDISGAKSWEKVEQGMRRMFVKEVMQKLPIMQHFMFGSLVPAVEGMGHGINPENGAGDHQGHTHGGDSWGECCGIKIPSTVAASEEARKRGAGDGLRRIPFD